MKRTSSSTLPRVTLSILDIPSIFGKTKPAIFARSTEYPKFSNRNLLKLNEKCFRIRKRKPRRSSKRPRLKSFVSAKSRIYLIKKNKK
jgi:hypothetical protein